jgi:L-aspartate oxidase
MKRHGLDYVLLDISHRPADFVRSRFPNIFNRCLSFGFDLTRAPIPVVPAAHYMCGGLVTDLNARTALAQLYAAGETAMTGLHGANRLASNSLLEAAVMGRRAAAAAREDATAAGELRPPDFPGWDPGRAMRNEERVLITQSWDEIRRLMWNYVGIVRSDARLARAMRRLQLIKQEVYGYYWDHLIDSDLIELRNLVEVAELVVRSATARKESRGLHYTIDYPERDDAKWLHDTLIAKSA